MDIQTRSKNALELKPPDDDDFFKFSKLDCEADIKLNFVFTLKDNAVGETGEYFLVSGDPRVDCGTPDEFSACSKPYSEDVVNDTFTFEGLNLKHIFGIDNCEQQEDLTKDFWLAKLNNENSLNSDNGDLIDSLESFTIDFKGPSTTTTITGVDVGTDNLEVHFQNIVNSDVHGYIAVYSEASDSDCSDGSLIGDAEIDVDVIDGHKASLSVDEKSIKITGLENDHFYQVAVATVDDYGNPSVLSAPKCAAPHETIGIGEAMNTDGEFCFVATAAFDSYDHPTVRVLRSFRDHFLKEIPLGSFLIKAYYSIGPSLAGMIQSDGEAKTMVRSALGLFAGFTTVLVQWGAQWVLLGLWSAVALGLMLGFTAPRAKEK